MRTVPNTPSPGDIRAELARQRVKLYKVAARVAIHPTRLSLILQERTALGPDVAARIMAAIMEEARGSNGAAR
jgi:plasmid maintenance system antidote protein VapI